MSRYPFMFLWTPVQMTVSSLPGCLSPLKPSNPKREPMEKYINNSQGLWLNPTFITPPQGLLFLCREEEWESSHLYQLQLKINSAYPQFTHYSSLCVMPRFSANKTLAMLTTWSSIQQPPGKLCVPSDVVWSF